MVAKGIVARGATASGVKKEAAGPLPSNTKDSSKLSNGRRCGNVLCDEFGAKDGMMRESVQRKSNL